MHWFTTDRVSVIIAALALLGALVGWLRNRTAAIEAKQDARDARGIAERAVSAAERAAGSQDSMATSLGSLAARTDQVEVNLEAYFPKRFANWELTRSDGSLFHLQNIGNQTAYEVEVTARNSARFEGPDVIGEWRVGTTKELSISESWQSGTPIVRVTWGITPVARDAGLPVEVWEHPLPPAT